MGRPEAPHSPHQPADAKSPKNVGCTGKCQYLIAGTSTTCKHRTYRTVPVAAPAVLRSMRTTRRSLLEVTTYRTANEDGANQIDNTAFLHRLCCSLCIYSNPCTTASSCKLSITMCKFIMKVWSAFFSRTSVTVLLYRCTCLTLSSGYELELLRNCFRTTMGPTVRRDSFCHAFCF